MITARGVLPAKTKPSSSAGSVEMLARPMMRNVSPTPGMRNSSDTRGSRTMLRKLSMRLLPRRSGIISVRSPATRTKPGASPRGEQSTPSGPTLASTKNGAASMKARYCGLMWSISFHTAAPAGWP